MKPQPLLSLFLSPSLPYSPLCVLTVPFLPGSLSLPFSAVSILSLEISFPGRSQLSSLRALLTQVLPTLFLGTGHLPAHESTRAWLGTGHPPPSDVFTLPLPAGLRQEPTLGVVLALEMAL